MNLLCIDIGSRTQDILLLDTAESVENAIQLVLPSPSVLVGRKIEAATISGAAIALVGETMGGGASTRALQRHLELGLKLHATPDAARTFNDDLDEVTSWGVHIISADEVPFLESVTIIKTGDVNLGLLGEALTHWEINFIPDVVAVAVLDHGAAPSGESDRVFRFNHLQERLKQDPSLETFIYTPDQVPPYLTRMQAVAGSVGKATPLVLMDTGAAAVMGASLDWTVGTKRRRISLNAGNSHTLAFHLDGSRVMGMFEHHTSLLSTEQVDSLLERLASGNLTAEEIQQDGGHGAVVLESGPLPFISVTGPRRQLLTRSRLGPYFASPFGSMMLAGCFGLARATALRLPEHRGEIERVLLLETGQ